VVTRLRAIALLAAAAGCGSFETPSIVLDLRILGIQAEPPEVVSPFDPDNPLDLELDDVRVCALIADPTAARRLHWEMVACAPTGSGRCSHRNRPWVALGFGTAEDPEDADDAPEICADLPAGPGLIAVLRDALERDSFSGFGGINVQVELWVHGEDEEFSEAQFGSKRILYAPEIPDGRVANRNPYLDELTVERAGGPTDPAETLPLGRCRDVAPLVVTPGELLTITPVEPEGVREDYVVPTLDGGSREFTENLTYAWYATAGRWGSENTGGPKDLVGNEPLLYTRWRAPEDPDVVGDGLDVAMWIVQRDERGGQMWYESCVRVQP
jgi:hypothetical protein